MTVHQAIQSLNKHPYARLDSVQLSVSKKRTNRLQSDELHSSYRRGNLLIGEVALKCFMGAKNDPTGVGTTDLQDVSLTS